MNEHVAWSRPERCAAIVGSDALDRHRFTEKTVLLTGELKVLSTQNGRRCFVDCLLLLIRTCKNVAVAIPQVCANLKTECQLTADRVCFQNSVEFLTTDVVFAKYDAILSVGSEAHDELPWTVVNSNGWLVRVSSGSINISDECTEFNPVGALAAACFGVCEVFKRLIRLKSSRGTLHDGLTFSLHTYQNGMTVPGPSLPDTICVDLLVVGIGAIGNGIIHLLSKLPLHGIVRFLDPQDFVDENLGTCLLIGPSNVGEKKAKFAENLLRGMLPATGYCIEVGEFASRIADNSETYPRQIVCALDNVQARHQAQMLWPDFLADGAIGAFPCQITRWEWKTQTACLRCVFQNASISAQAIAHRATGLLESRTLEGESVVTEADVDSASTEKVEWLRERVGQKICSVIQEGLAEQLSEDDQDDSFAPSVPFVACMSACMVMAELIAHVARWPTKLDTRFQFDALRGPQFGEMFPEECATRCFRIERRKIVDFHRSNRLLHPPFKST